MCEENPPARRPADGVEDHQGAPMQQELQDLQQRQQRQRRQPLGLSLALTPFPVLLYRLPRNPRRRRDGIEDSEEFGSAAAVAAAVAQSEGYKPREERGWEEFHPDLELDARFKVFNAAEVDGTAPESPTTAQETIPLPPTTPPKRKVGRPPRDPSAYSGMTATLGRTPIVLPIHNQTPKERLDLKRPSYRRTDRTSLFESKVPDSDCQISEAVARVGFQQTNQYQRPAHRLIKANDGGWESNNNNNIRNGNNNDSDIDEASTGDTDASTGAIPGTSGASVVVDRSFGRVEYDMDEQDDKWLEAINRERQAADVEPVTRELLEITITKIEKEWHALEKRIPKPNPKPPQTQRPRSSSAAAVNGEAGAGPSSGEEPDSKSRLFLKMKTSQGVLAVLDGAMTLKAFCDRHCPLDYIETSKVAEATRAARHFYRKKMRGRFWADSESTAALITAQYSVAYDSTESSSGSMGASSAYGTGTNTKGRSGERRKSIVWKLPSGAPVIPSSVFDAVDTAMARFSLRKRREFVADVCRYWTLKREARRGAALLKRLQLQMETFPSMELTRRNFVSMGPTGRARLQRRIEFVDMLVHDLNHLRSLSRTLVQREAIKLRAAKAEKDFVDTCYFPVARDIAAIIEKAQSLDNNVFSTGLSALQRRIHARFYTTTLTFARDFADVKYSDIHARKTLGKHIINSVQPCFETAVITEAAVLQRPVDELRKELEEVLRAATELRVDELIGQSQGEDSVMPDAPLPGQTVAEDVVMSEAHQDTKETMAKTPLENIAHDAHVLEKPISQTTPPQTTESSLPPSSALGPQDSVDKSVHMLQSTNQNQTPPTPPQSTSNMSFLSDVSAPLPCNVLTDGGPLWYLSDFGVEGLSVVDQYSCDETVHALDEELTDLEDEELKGLDRDIERALGLASGVKIQIPNRPLVKVQATQMGPSMSEAKEQPEEQPEERSERCPPNQNAPEKESLGKDVEMVDVIASTESQPVGPANDPDATPDSVDDDSAPPRNTASGSEDTPEPATSTPPTDSAYLPTSPRCAASVAISLETPQITVTDASLATSIANGCDSEPASAADPDNIDGDADLKDGEGEAEAEADPAAQDTAHNQTQPGVQDEADTHVEAQDKEEGTVQENANFDLLASTIAPSDNNLDLLLVTANKDTLPLITRATRASVAAAREAEAQQLELEQRELELERKKRTRSSTRTRK
ncbi:Enhancer of polycomb-like protein [Ceratocystis platani]|uniref:Enhancer of polycomb-like protein n=1 Tax=Ceratocystis fimbriata f. sp. platani TaxID=88771 RepID=A0A0F8B4N5_CERFI|nr:Enhancer of polycomb-like protein [Ceratocystis platani]